MSNLYTLGYSYSPQPKETNTNYESWEVIKAVIKAYGPTNYWALVKICNRHVHGTQADQGKGGRPWIDYLIARDYLVEVD